ncbi:MAG TPA: PGDYG domain-containing protein [Steroidobacteraceae bacterium]|nr:PGDYG domain-containing protein [Steroidobacteraceae bacterium]
MLQLEHIDLRTDPLACSYVKDETVEVQFARTAGSLQSREGANAYAVGDALLRSQSGDRWCVSRARFELRYLPADGQRVGADGRYRNQPLPVLARRMEQPFTLLRSQGGDRLVGAAGDWLLQYAPGDYGVAVHERFERLYRPVG